MTWRFAHPVLVALAGTGVGLLGMGLASDRLRSRARGAVAVVLASVGAWASAAAVRYTDDTEPSTAANRSLTRDVAVEAAADGLIVVDGDGIVVDCNPAAGVALGCLPESAVGEPVATVEPELAALIDGSGTAVRSERDRPGSDASLDANSSTDVADADGATGAVEGPRVERGTPSLTRMTDEGKRHFEGHVSSFDRPELRGQVITLRDVTARHRLRRRIGVLNRLLRHDLRNEMNVVLGYADLIGDQFEKRSELRDPETDDELKTALERITGAAETMLDRAETVRHVEATLDADRSARTRLDVVGLIRAQVNGMVMEYHSADPQITVDAPDSAWISATGLIDTVFDNLLENAIEHSHRERPTIEITVAESAEFVAVTVADDGPGIPKQELETFQSEVETQITHSSGLGLWLVVWITEASGGRVSFDVGETGTAVTVEFPTADPPE